MARALLLIDHGFQDAEVIYPLYRLMEAGHDVVVCGPSAKTEYKGKYGYPITSAVAAGTIDVDGHDLLIIPGGQAPERLRDLPDVVRLVKAADQADLVIGAICRGPRLLVAAGVVANRDVTSFVEVRDALEQAGANWEDAEVMVDGNLVTARRPEDLPAFMRAVLRLTRKGSVSL